MSTRDTQSGGEAPEVLLDAVRHTTRFAEIEWVNRTGSTNADLMERAGQGASDGVVRIADHQTAGQGRLDRQWEDRPGRSLLLSVLVRPSRLAPARKPEQYGLLTTALGVAAAEAVAQCGVPGVALKWPNDLVHVTTESPTGYMKLSGILAQSALGADPAVVLGIGINVSWSADELAAMEDPRPGASPALSLAQLGTAPDRRTLAAALLTHLDGLLALTDTELLDRYREHSATLGTRVRVDLGGEFVEGTAVELTDRGLLVVQTLQGERVTVASGDVVSVRPA